MSMEQVSKTTSFRLDEDLPQCPSISPLLFLIFINDIDIDLDADTITSSVNALVMPYFHYCSPAWSNAAPFRLSKINKKVVDASVFLGREDNYSIYNMLDKDISLLTFKALNNIAPNY